MEDSEDYSQEEIVDTGISAIALYDYQAAADDEISFDPDDTITHIEKASISQFLPLTLQINGFVLYFLSFI